MNTRNDDNDADDDDYANDNYYNNKRDIKYEKD